MSRPAKNDSKEMKCPKCGRATLKRKENGVVCSFCGYILSPGEEVKFRLYELLKQSS
jgi:ribosomal protein L37AE/L43A